MPNPKTATLRSPSPPRELLDELHFVGGLLHWVTPSGRRKRGPIGSPTASSTGKVYMRFGYKGRRYYVHNVVVWMLTGEWVECDHEDGDGTNNLASNLRPCTHSQNLCNMAGWAQSGHKGLYELTPGYYQAQVKLNGKAYSRCGRDKAELLAWLTAKREELHGEYHHH